MTGDLHVHTRHSDSTYAPEEALELAHTRGLSHISFVDHDTTQGAAEAVSLGAERGVVVIPGVEISAYDPLRSRRVHLLGYNYRIPASTIEQICGPLRRERHDTTLWQVGQLRRAGYDIALTEVRAQARGTCPGPELSSTCSGDGWPADPVLYKQHIMALLIQKGYTDAIYSALYKTLFKNGGICDLSISYVSAFDALAAIKADGGSAVLAHPGQLDSWDIVPELAEAGLDGIELYHPDHTNEDHRRVRELADRHSLLMTGGSDDHGAFGPDSPLGGIIAPADALERLGALAVP